MTEHELKCWPRFFFYTLAGAKRFEVRKNDRDFRVGDTLLLREWDPEYGYTGQEARFEVTYTLMGMGTQPGYMVMSLREPADLAARCVALEAALEAVEWVTSGDMDGGWACWWCDAESDDVPVSGVGHKPDCQRQAALAADGRSIADAVRTVAEEARLRWEDFGADPDSVTGQALALLRVHGLGGEHE